MRTRNSRGKTEACNRKPGAPRRWDSGWATPETPAGFPVMLRFSRAAADRHGLSPWGHTCQQECLRMERESERISFSTAARQGALFGHHCVDPVPELSLSAWNCRTEEPPPMVISWAQSSTGFSNTRRARRPLKGLQRGCLRDKQKRSERTKALWLINKNTLPKYHHKTMSQQMTSLKTDITEAAGILTPLTSWGQGTVGETRILSARFHTGFHSEVTSTCYIVADETFPP